MISFAKFIRILNPRYKMPKYMELFMKDIKSNKRYCVCLHKSYGRRMLMGGSHAIKGRLV